MAEYIEREAANFAIQKKMQEYINKSMQPIGFGKYCEDSVFTNAALGCRAAIEEVNSIPAADVRPVARCGECKHNKGKKIWADGDETFDCANGHGYPPLDWFCADGEKMEES